LARASTLDLSTTVGGTALGAQAAAASSSNWTGSWSTTVDGVQITFTPVPAGSKLTWDSTDKSVGIDSAASSGLPDDTDEVDEGEFLKITFSEAVTVTEMVFMDLFAQETPNYSGNTYSEVGGYLVDNGSALNTFSANASQVPGTDGAKTVALNAAVQNTITLTAPKDLWSSLGSNQDMDFALRSISFTKVGGPSARVPELDGRSAFGAIGLLVGGLFAGTSRRRRLPAGTTSR